MLGPFLSTRRLGTIPTRLRDRYLVRMDAPRPRAVLAIVTVVAAGVLAIASTDLLWSALRRTPVYLEPIVGNPTWDNSDKERDFRALSVVLGAIGVFTLGIHALLKRLSVGERADEVGRALRTVLGFALIPACFWFGRNVAYGDQYLHPYDAAGAILVVLATLALLGRHRGQLDGPAVYELVGLAVLIDALGFCVGCAVATLLDRIAPTLLAGRPWASWAILASVTGLAGSSVAWAIVTARDIPEARQRLHRLVWWAQVPLPLLFFVLLTPRLVIGGRTQPAPYTAWLPVVLAIPAVLAWFDLARKARRARASELSITESRGVLSPLCLGAVAVFLQVLIHGLPLFSPDPFHLGEQILPWHQWSRFGKVPYVDFVPIHGLMSLIRGFLNDYLYQGTVASFAYVDPLLASASVLLTFLAIWAFAGPYPALYVALALGLSSPMFFDRCFFLMPGLLVLCLPRVMRRPTAWLWVWGIVSVLMAGYNFAVGIAFGLGTVPVAAWFVLRAARTERTALIRSAGAALALVLLVLAFGPTRAIVLGFLAYIRENAATNTVLHGILWQVGLNWNKRVPGIPSHRFLLEVVRLAWIAAIVVLGYVGWRELTVDRWRRRPQVVMLCVCGIGTLLCLTSWTIGRIDPGNWSRPGAVSFLALGTLLPTILLVGRRPGESTAIVTTMAVLAGLISSPETRSLPERLMTRAVSAHPLPEGFRLADGRAIDLPKLGRGLDNPDLFGELKALKTAIDPLLATGETYLDLTNRSAYYYYLDLPVPTLYAANFIAGNRETQARMFQQLRQNPPLVALIAPSINHDNAPASLRSYYLYRDVLLRLVAIERERFLFLVDPARAPEAGPIGSKEQLDLLDRVYWRAELQDLPASWGRSWDALAPRFQTVQQVGPDRLASSTGAEKQADGQYVSHGTESRLMYRIDPVRGDQADFLRFRFDFRRLSGRRQAKIEVRWQVNGTMVDGPFFELDRGTLLVPLGAYPRWLLASNIEAVEFVVIDGGAPLRFRIDDVTLLQLDPLD